jgi:hypothetical protein
LRVSKEETWLRKSFQSGGDINALLIHRSSYFIREDKASVEELNKINFEIENIIKQKIVTKQRHQGNLERFWFTNLVKDMIQKVERAKVSGTLRLHKHSDVGKSFASNMISKDTTYEDINTSRGV